MFCNHCGAQLQADSKFCPSCGQTVVPGPAPTAPAPAAGRFAHHVRVLAILWIALSALRLLRGVGGLAVARMVRFSGDAWLEGWNWPVPHFVNHILSVIGVGLLVLAIAGLIAGWGLLERRPWARTLAIVLAVISLFNPILGTALGIYTLWVLVRANAEQEWRRMAG